MCSFYKMPPKTQRATSKNASDSEHVLTKLQARINQLQMEKSDLQDALKRTQITLQHMENSKPRPKANIDWTHVFSSKLKNLNIENNECDTDSLGATSSELSIDEEVSCSEEGEETDAPEGE